MMRWLTLLSICTVFGSSGCSTFRCSSVALIAMRDLPTDLSNFKPPLPESPQYKMKVRISFSQAVDQASVKAPDTVTVDVKNAGSGATANGIPGTIHYYVPPGSGPGGVFSAFFISEKPLSDYIGPINAPGYSFKITVHGSPKSAGSGVITNVLGEVLDGDKDGEPGGDCIEAGDVLG